MRLIALMLIVTGVSCAQDQTVAPYKPSPGRSLGPTAPTGRAGKETPTCDPLPQGAARDLIQKALAQDPKDTQRS